jgi:SAM-dependent methyltransferase
MRIACQNGKIVCSFGALVAMVGSPEGKRQPAMAQQVYDEKFWDELYGSKDKIWSGNPNAHLVAQASGLVAGKALDVGSGEGGDAIWLAQRGWHVTGIDLSTIALGRAAAHAAQAGPEIAEHVTWEHVDLNVWQPPRRAFDLVSAHYMHLPLPLRDEVYRALAAAVSVGGTLLVVGHEPSELHKMKHDAPGMFFVGDDMAALLEAADWDIVTNISAPGRTHTEEDGTELKTFDVVFRASRKR